MRVVRLLPFPLAAALAMGGAADTPAPDLPEVVAMDFSSPEDFTSWQPRPTSTWKAAPGAGHYQLVEKGKPGKHRRPFSWSIWQGAEVAECVVDVKARCLTKPEVLGRDVLIIFGFQDADHYYYAHFSAENAQVHNIVAKVNGGARTPLRMLDPRRPLLLTGEFHHLRLHHDPATGEIRGWVDGKPSLHARDTTFKGGKVGIGSFDDTVDFDSFMVSGNLLETR